MDIDFYGLRIFCQVVRDKTFSAAARSLGITQPTVSQQIAKLESSLGGRLFERVGHDVFLTAIGKELYTFAEGALESADEFSERLRNQRETPMGLVRYAMPESCQWTPHYRRIMGQIQRFPDVRFEITIQPNEQIVQALLEGRIDFGFIVGERLHPDLRFEKFSDERYSAVAAAAKFFEPFRSHEPEKLRLVGYPGWEAVASQWLAAHGYLKKFRNRVAAPTVYIGTLAGAIHATQEGAGVAILPTHCVAGELEEKSMKEFSPGKSPVTSPVHVARRTGEKLPRRVSLVLEMLKEAKRRAG
ncbi:MAG: LysR family transcriptional regulator [Bacteriovoracia bacterium]